MAKETEEIQHICRLADVDYELVIDQSTSVGGPTSVGGSTSVAWNITMYNIAQYWIRQAIQPSGSKKCGNHSAARKYSGAQTWELHLEDYYHDRWIDFEPPSEEEYSQFPNYTEYVAFMFENEAYKGGATHTAEALSRKKST